MLNFLKLDTNGNSYTFKSLEQVKKISSIHLWYFGCFIFPITNPRYDVVVATLKYLHRKPIKT